MDKIVGQIYRSLLIYDCFIDREDMLLYTMYSIYAKNNDFLFSFYPSKDSVYFINGMHIK